ncbi:MAG: hypothetical protein E7333_05525 [Clostridiales bacterium]|nr:hypothetical protein [Clostridiales bacterium]
MDDNQSYVPLEVAQKINLRNRMEATENAQHQNHDPYGPQFQNAFKIYFGELGICIRDWDGLFREKAADNGNITALSLSGQGQVIGFIQLKRDTLSHWFFEEKLGFIREFWVSTAFRKQGC